MQNIKQLESANLSVETALVTSSLVLMNQALTSHMIENGYRFFQSRLSRGFVAIFNGFENALYLRAHHRALAGVALASGFRLPGAFSSLGRIRHERPLFWAVSKLANHYDTPPLMRQSSGL